MFTFVCVNLSPTLLPLTSKLTCTVILYKGSAAHSYKQCADDKCGKRTWHHYTTIHQCLLGTIFSAAYLFTVFALTKINLMQKKHEKNKCATFFIVSFKVEWLFSGIKYVVL